MSTCQLVFIVIGVYPSPNAVMTHKTAALYQAQTSPLKTKTIIPLRIDTMALLYMFLQTAAFVSAWTLVHRHVASHGPVAAARKAVMLNSWFYSLASAVMLALMFMPQYEHIARRLYHLSKVYEYVDVLGVRAGGGDIDVHFAVHHLTTPYLTYVRVLYYSQGWRVVAALNAFHHVLMYAYFGGARSLRCVLPVTGTIQLLVGLGGEAWILWKKRVDGQQPLWPHEFVVALFGMYLVLWLRDIRRKASMQSKVDKSKST